MPYQGNDEFRKEGMAHYHDLRETYAKHMEYHGLGFGLFHPISARDMTPPCCGYFDRNGDWNLICNLSSSSQAQRPQNWPSERPTEAFAALQYDPVMSTQINIEWQPKTSQNVEAYVMSGGGQTPDNLPAGADVQIKYSSKSRFGAVLMTLRPITLHAYNDERLFLDWLDANRSLLFDTYGTELKKYGLWIVTRTYNAPGCSINAWMDNSKNSVISLKAKASMLGELADEQMQWNDKASDKDWSHYKAVDGDAVVVFMDGIEVVKSDWFLEGIRQKFGKRSPSRSPTITPPTATREVQKQPAPTAAEELQVRQRRASAYLVPPPPTHAANTLADGAGNISTAPIDVGVMPTWSKNTTGPTRIQASSGGNGATPERRPRPKSFAGGEASYLVTTPTAGTGQIRHDSGFGSIFTKMDAPAPWSPNDPDFNSPVDKDTLKDAGFQPLSRRSVSIRRGSDASSKAASLAPSSKTATSNVSRAKSLRRETRSISGQSDHSRQHSVS